MLLPLSLLLSLTLPARGAPDPARLAGDDALAALAEGRHGAAVRALRARLARAADPEEEHALRCILGQALRLAGDERGAVEELARVPVEAGCGPRAAFDRADALQALGRVEEAAAVYAALGEVALGEDRDRALAAHLERLADDALGGTTPDRALAIAVLYQALELQLASSRRLALAERIAGLLLAEDGGHRAQPWRDQGGRVWAELLGAVARGVEPAEDHRLRLLAARVGDATAGLVAIAHLPPAPEVAEVRALLALETAPAAGLEQLAAVVAARPDDRGLRALLAERALQARRLDLAAEHLAVLAQRQGEGAGDALLDLARLRAEQGPDPMAAADAALATAQEWLDRYSTGARRSEVEALRGQLLDEAAGRALAAGEADALARVEALLRVTPGASLRAWEAGVVAYRRGEVDEARRRWEELVAGQPGSPGATRAVSSLARLRAVDQGEAEAARAWLRGLAEQGGGNGAAAAQELTRLDEADVGLEVLSRQPARGAPTVRVHARNVEQVTVRLHRIDAEAFLRAGGGPASLPALDVGVIAPDREWTAPVPGYAPHRDLAFDLPLRTPGPGLYAVTVATDRREARGVVLVSDDLLVARGRGRDLVVGVARGDRAASGVRVLAAHTGGIAEARTDAAGLARLEVEPGEVTVLSDGPAGPALARLEWVAAAEEEPLRVGLDLDRPVYRAGDRVGFRAVARREGAAVDGAWEVWLDGPGGALPRRALRADRYGAVQGELELPLVDAAIGGVWDVMAAIPGEDAPRSLGQVQVADPPEAARRLSLRWEGEQVEVEVTEADGRPAVDAPVLVEDGLGGEPTPLRTDRAGRVLLEPPAPGLPWAPQARLPGSARWQAPSPRPAGEGLDLHLDRTALRAGERAVATVRGPPGLAVLRLVRVDAPFEAPSPMEDPWAPALEERFEGPEAWAGTGVEAPHVRQHTELARLEVVLGDGPARVELPPLDGGRIRVEVEHADARRGGAAQWIEVAEGPAPRLGALPVTAAGGDRLELPVEGPALVTAEAAGVEAAALVLGARGGALRMALPRREGVLELVATGLSRQVHASRLRVETAPEVEVQVVEADRRWQVEVRVTDPAGRPAQAQVALRALDQRLVVDRGQGATASRALVSAMALAPSAGALAARLASVAPSTGISEALLAESARQAEAAKAEAATRGAWSGEALGMLFEESAIVGDEVGLGGLGTRGRGSGGGGYGAGAGGFGTVGRGGVARLVGPAITQRVLWHVAETDAQGVLRLSLDRPPAADWVVQAVAVTPGSAALGQAEVAPQGPRLLVPDLAGAGPEDRVRPTAQVWNPGAATSVTLAVDGAVQTVALPAGEAVAVALPELAAGQQRLLRLLDGATLLDEARVTLPALAPVVAAGEGRLLRVAVDPGGRAPLAALVREAAPVEQADPGALAAAGRAALLALPRVAPGDAPAVRARAVAAVAGLRLLGPAPRAGGQSEVVAFLALAQAALPEVGLTRGEVDAAVGHLAGLPANSDERVAQQWALAVAGRPVDEPSLGRLQRDAERLSPESRSLLARTLLLLDRGAEAAPLVAGDGPHALLARAALGEQVDASALLDRVVPPGDPQRAAWIEALSTIPGGARRAVEVRVDGALVATLDPRRGGELRAAVPAGATVEVGGDAPVLVQRGELVAGPAPLAPTRRPIGPDGRPVASADAGACGSAEEPCLIAPGDLLLLPGRPGRTARIPGGLRPVEGGVRAEVEGRYLVSGWRAPAPDGGEVDAAPIHVEVRAGAVDPAAVGPRAALALARLARDAGEDPLPWLAPWPAFDDLEPGLRPTAMALRLERALRDGEDADRVAAFEALRDADPSANLELAQVAAVARAYAGIGRPDRALAGWRAGLGAAFLGEAAGVRRLEEGVSRFTALQAMRMLLRRYPAVPVVGEAAFHLPERLAALADEGLPVDLVEAGLTPTDLHLQAAAWDREFLALHPDAPQAPQAGLHLARGLLALRAWSAAAEWADRVADRAPESEVLDALRYVEGLARAELGQDVEARRLLDALATAEVWPRADGSVGPAGLRADARYALARLADARGQRDEAREGYEAVAGDFPEAARAAEVLSRVALSPEPLVVLEDSDAALLPVTSTNVGEAQVRAYRLDLRTVFLRDGGVAAAREVHVAGVSPAWAGARRLDSGPFPVERQLALPLAGAGAWLVELDAAGVSARALVVRSSLAVAAEDGADGRRLQVRQGDAPAAGVEVRALDPGGGVVATRTDLRGVAMVPTGAPVLVFLGDAVAFTPPDEEPVGYGYAAPGASSSLMQNLDRRVQQQRMLNELGYQEQFKADAADALEASAF